MNRLKEIIKSLNLTQTQFATGLGLTQSTISGIISGKSQLTKIVAFLIEKTYGISSEWLMYGNGEMWVAMSDDEKRIQEDNSLLRRIEKNPEIREILEMLLKAELKELKKVKEVVKALVGE